MKSKAIDHYNKTDLQEAMALCDLLFSCFNIKSAEKAAQSYSYELDEEFCARCDEHRENCECSSEGRYVREYDDGADYED